MNTSNLTHPMPSAQIWNNYDVNHVPPHPGEGWTRFVCISDTHSRKFNVPPGDVLLHAGDLSSWGYPEQIEFTLTWLRSLAHPIKMYVF
jgi:3',5'-cyclic AMP phosphodiesterase CpdA